MQDGTKYIWTAEIGHYVINKYINQQVDITQFRFAWDNVDWIIDVPHITYDKAVEYINKYKDFLSKIGDINKEFYIMPNQRIDPSMSHYYINQQGENKDEKAS